MQTIKQIIGLATYIFLQFLFIGCGGGGSETSKTTPPMQIINNPDNNVTVNIDTTSILNRPFYRVCGDNYEKYIFSDDETLIVSRTNSLDIKNTNTPKVKIEESYIDLYKDKYDVSELSAEPLIFTSTDNETNEDMTFYFTKENAKNNPSNACMDKYRRKEVYIYDKSGNAIESVLMYLNGNSVKREFSYRSDGSLSRISKVNFNAEGDETYRVTSDYDTLGNLSKSETTKNGDEFVRTYSYTYNIEGKVVSEKFETAEGILGETKFTYDEKGNLLTKNYNNTAGWDSKITYTYYKDGTNKTYNAYTRDLKGEIDTDKKEYNSKGILIKRFRESYDAEENFTGSTLEVYNDKHMLLKREEIDSKEIKTTKNYVYNTENQVISYVWTKTDGTYGETNTTYHSNGKVKDRVQKDYATDGTLAYDRDITYDDKGHTLTESYHYADGRGSETKYTYDSKGNKVTYSRKYLQSSGTYYVYDYTYYVDGSTKTETLTYYDAVGNVTSSRVYRYDENGERLTQEATDSEGVTTTNTYTYNTEGKVLSDTWVKSDGTYGETNTTYHSNGLRNKVDSYRYDNHGSVTYQEHREYDDKNHILLYKYTNEDGSGYIHIYNIHGERISFTYIYADGHKYTNLFSYYSNGNKKTEILTYYDIEGNITSSTMKEWDEEGNLIS